MNIHENYFCRLFFFELISKRLIFTSGTQGVEIELNSILSVLNAHMLPNILVTRIPFCETFVLFIIICQYFKI
jgi:hypothetical protein